MTRCRITVKAYFRRNSLFYQLVSILISRFAIFGGWQQSKCGTRQLDTLSKTAPHTPSHSRTPGRPRCIEHAPPPPPPTRPPLPPAHPGLVTHEQPSTCCGPHGSSLRRAWRTITARPVASRPPLSSRVGSPRARRTAVGVRHVSHWDQAVVVHGGAVRAGLAFTTELTALAYASRLTCSAHWARPRNQQTARSSWVWVTTRDNYRHGGRFCRRWRTQARSRCRRHAHSPEYHRTSLRPTHGLAYHVNALTITAHQRTATSSSSAPITRWAAASSCCRRRPQIPGLSSSRRRHRHSFTTPPKRHEKRTKTRCA